MEHNILYVERGLGRGGSSLSLKYLIDGLDRTRFKTILLFNGKAADATAFAFKDTEIIFLEEPTPLTERFPAKSALKYIVSCVDFFTRVLPTAVKLIFLIRKRRIDLVHLNNDIISHISSILACNCLRIPFVCHCRSTRALTRSEKLMSSMISRFIVLSETGCEFLVRQGIPIEKITISYDPFPTDVPSSELNSNLVWLRGKESLLKVGACSRLSCGKGHDVFLRAAKIVLDKYPGTHFFIFGKEDIPGFQASLVTLAEQLGVISNLTFAGWQSDVMSAIACLDVLVDVSSLNEGLRRTIVEGMLLGKPVIATDVGQTREVIEGSQAGFLVKPNAPEELAARLSELLGNERLCREMGSKGKRFACEKFDLHKNAAEIQSLYEKVLCGKRMA